MAKGYWIARVTVNDPEGYKAYVAANASPIAAYGGRILVRGGKFENPEGVSRPRNVIIEFESYEKALEAYNSEGYQAAIKLREPHSEMDFLIIEGYDGPQMS
jgi:uncharacterized protein (DUF1330 family)